MYENQSRNRNHSPDKLVTGAFWVSNILTPEAASMFLYMLTKLSM